VVRPDRIRALHLPASAKVRIPHTEIEKLAFQA